MHTFDNTSDFIKYLTTERISRKKIGFVPTMGALHEGHLSLVKYAKNDCDLVVCSIFVNPAQFNNKADLAHYPRTIDSDLEMLKTAGCDVAYKPLTEDIYEDPENIRTFLQFGPIEDILEGKYRPGHFRGVGLVVTKFFNIVHPDFTYFGQKDLQQLYLIRQLIKDLSYDIKLIAVPTVREKDGLAMSSRNRRIREEDRPFANKYYKALLMARDLLKDGKNIAAVKTKVAEFIQQYPVLNLEYFEMVDTGEFTLTDRIKHENKTALCIAGYINNIRLIDNVMYNN